MFSFAVYLTTPQGLVGQDCETAAEAADWVAARAAVDSGGLAQLREEDFDLRLTLYAAGRQVALVLRLAD